MLQGNLSWSGDNIVNIDCVTEFVMMYRDADTNVSSESAVTVLCPGYQILSSGSQFWCQYQLSDVYCGTRIYLMLGKLNS